MIKSERIKMKFFTKLFIGVLMILTTALGFAEYFTVAGSFKTILERETDSALTRHQLVKYALSSDMRANEDKDGSTSEILHDIVSRIKKGGGIGAALKEVKRSEIQEGLKYTIEKENDIETIVITSYFENSDNAFELKTTEDLSSVFRDSEFLEQKCARIFGLTMGIGAILSFILSFALTKPIKRLNKAGRSYACGEQYTHIIPGSNDEIGELTGIFNEMVDSIEEKIEALRYSVKKREDFIASFAHEIKTPMTGIIGYADRIYQMDLNKEQMKEEAGYILNEGMRLEALSFKLMDLIALDRRDFLLEEIKTTDLLIDLKNSLIPSAANKNVKLVVAGDEAYVRVEYDLFKTLLMNLTDNALKSGALVVYVKGKNAGKRYVISVLDNGRGIPEEELDRITEAFYMVDKSRSRKEHGSGLGLALCKKIAAIHGTDIQIRSEEGKGTLVRIVIPVEERLPV